MKYILYLFKNWSMIWGDHMMRILWWGGRRNNMSTKIINGAFVRPKSFDVSSITVSGICNFSKWNSLIFNLAQRFTAIQHRVIKPSPRPCPCRVKSIYKIINPTYMFVLSNQILISELFCDQFTYLSMFSRDQWQGHWKPWQGLQLRSN